MLKKSLRVARKEQIAMANWRFYGRGVELAKLESMLQLRSQSRGFNAIRIVGRRGVGKTELLAEVGRRGSRDVPVIAFEIPSSGGAGQAVTDLNAEIDRKGMKDLLADMPTVDWDRDLGWRFFHIVHHLICKGAVVGLDEFHNAEHARLITPVKRLIDEFNSIGGCKPRGKLVLTGSHQQHMLRLFQADQPLYGRIDETVKLHQWPAATVLEIAREHGLLAPSSRFLTLLTAFGGHPKHWRRFVVGASEDRNLIRNFQEWSSHRVGARHSLRRSSLCYAPIRRKDTTTKRLSNWPRRTATCCYGWLRSSPEAPQRMNSL
ncbi:MAG: ATP-binding protein [Albidovulum sp.]|nr:ATP-binding protein [Albidovulum sp.]